MDNLRHLAHGLYKRAAETVTGPLKASQFEEKRVLTPQEFVAAGDYLVRACPTWAWEGGDARKRRPYLPADKQFLVTRNVPCMKRASELEQYNPAASETALGGDDEGWVATHQRPPTTSTTAATAAADAAASSSAPGNPAAAAAGLPPLKPDDGDDDIPDISELELAAADDEAALPPPGLSSATAGPAGTHHYLRAQEPDGSGFVRTRTYDLSITYDQYYQVPRMWLVGFDESRRPLAPAQVLEDVSEEHARKTITVDPHPHLPLISAASIHPCRHAEVMKRLVDNLLAAGKEFSVNHYLVLFLKFIASVVPTIQYDYTMSVGN